MSEFQHSFSQKNKIFKYIIIIIIDILILIRTISNLNAFFTSHSLSKREIVNAIKRMKNGKAAGADNIPAEVLKTDPYTRSVRKVSDLFFLCEHLMDYNLARLHEPTLNLSAHA